MKRKAIILSVVVVLSTMVAGIGASATAAPGPAQQAPVSPQQSPVSAQQPAQQTNDTDADGQVGTQSAPAQTGGLPRPIEVPPSQLKFSVSELPADIQSIPNNVRGNGGYAVNPTAGFVSKKGDAAIRPSPEYQAGGPTLIWPAYDFTGRTGPANDALPSIYFKTYTLRAVGPEVEIWVATDLAFPGDNRTPENTTVSISDAQALYLADEFANNIEPQESRLYREPVPQYGINSPLYGQNPFRSALPDDYYQSTDNESRTVILVDNVRDKRFYDGETPVYVAGLFSPAFRTLTGRNVMVLDTNAWDERLGGPTAPWQTPAAPGESFGIESTTAHEYQHLLHGYEDPDETTWINEGLSEITPYLVGYGLPSSIEFYERFTSNSLIEWEDQVDEAGDIAVLADYGAAGLFQIYGKQQIGLNFTQSVFESDANGVESIEDALNQTNAERNLYEFYQDFSTALVVDGLNTTTDRYQIENVNFDINNTQPAIYTRKNLVAAYGNAYEELNLGNDTINDFRVSGLAYPESNWEVVSDPPGESSKAALYSQKGNNLNNWAIFNADLSGTENPTLKFDTYYAIERGFDYGFVQISTDGGETWTSLSNQNTTSYRASPTYLNPVAKRNLPGFTGISGGNLSETGTTYANASWVTETFDLSEYAGQDVLIAFRYVTDPASVKQGWYVRNISIEAAGISYSGASEKPFVSIREVRENAIRYMYSFIGIREDGSTEVVQLPPKTFVNGSPMSLDQFLTGEFNRTIFAVTWAPENRDTGTVPYGYEVNPGTDGGDGGNGGDGQQPGANTLTIIGQGDIVHYGFSVSGEVGENGKTVEQQFVDEIGAKTGSGVTGPARDSFTFTGELVRLEVSGNAKVLLNGKSIDPDNYPNNVLRVSGVNQVISYELAASSSVSEAYGVEQQFADGIEGNTASGVSGPSVDAYAFNGGLVRLEISGEAKLILNGEPIDAADYPDNIITFEGVGEVVNYEFTASGSVGEYRNSVEQQWADRIARNSGSGVVGPSEDSYTFAGELRSLSVSGNAEVTVNGEEVNENEV